MWKHHLKPVADSISNLNWVKTIWPDSTSKFQRVDPSLRSNLNIADHHRQKVVLHNQFSQLNQSNRKKWKSTRQLKNLMTKKSTESMLLLMEQKLLQIKNRFQLSNQTRTKTNNNLIKKRGTWSKIFQLKTILPQFHRWNQLLLKLVRWAEEHIFLSFKNNWMKRKALA